MTDPEVQHLARLLREAPRTVWESPHTSMLLAEYLLAHGVHLHEAGEPDKADARTAVRAVVDELIGCEMGYQPLRIEYERAWRAYREALGLSVSVSSLPETEGGGT